MEFSFEGKALTRQGRPILRDNRVTGIFFGRHAAKADDSRM